MYVFPQAVQNSINIFIGCMIFHHHWLVVAICLGIFFNIINNTVMNISLWINASLTQTQEENYRDKRWPFLRRVIYVVILSQEGKPTALPQATHRGCPTLNTVLYCCNVCSYCSLTSPLPPLYPVSSLIICMKLYVVRLFINFPSLPLIRFNYCQASVAFKKTKCGNFLFPKFVGFFFPYSTRKFP